MGQGAFRALTRGYIHWSSERLSKTQFNDNNPDYCFVLYDETIHEAYWLVQSLSSPKRVGGNASIARATCECVAG